MKKFFALFFFLILLACVGVLGASAADYSYEDVKVTVPDFFINDAQWADGSDYVFAFSDADVNIELNISVYANENYSYEGLDVDNLEDYAQLLREEYETDDYSPIESVTVVSHTTAEGVAGIRSDLVFTDEHYVFYWFATEERCYDFNFYIYNDDYLNYPEQIIQTLVIGNPADSQLTTTDEDIDETMPVLSDEDVEADGDGYVEKEGDYSEITILPVPAIIFVAAFILLVILLIVKKKNKSKNISYVQAPQQSANNGGIYYDANTGNYFSTVSTDENVVPGQPVGYIYYPVQSDTTHFENYNNTQN